MADPQLETRKEIIDYYTEGDRPPGGGLTAREMLLLGRIQYLGRDIKLNWLKAYKRRKGR